MTPKMTKKVPILNPKMGHKMETYRSDRKCRHLGAYKNQVALRNLKISPKWVQKGSQNDLKMVQDSPKNGPR